MNRNSTVHAFIGKMVPPTWAHIGILERMIRDPDTLSVEFHTTRKTQYGVDALTKSRAWYDEVNPLLSKAQALYISQDLIDFCETLLSLWEDRAGRIVIWGGEDRVRDLKRAVAYMQTKRFFRVEIDMQVVQRDETGISGTRAREAAVNRDIDQFMEYSPCISLFDQITAHK